jgi:hypothetical protein
MHLAKFAMYGVSVARVQFLDISNQRYGKFVSRRAPVLILWKCYLPRLEVEFPRPSRNLTDQLAVVESGHVVIPFLFGRRADVSRCARGRC